MKVRFLFFTLLLTFCFNPAHAELYYEVGLEGGGDDELASTTADDSIAPGGGIKFAIGIQNPINDDASAAIRLSVGYLFDSIDANDGEADIDTLTFDALYIINSGVHSFGIGGTMHMSPEYSERTDSSGSFNIEFDDAVGVVLQYGYHLDIGMEIVARFTQMDYEVGSASIDAGSFGVFISNGF